MRNEKGIQKYRMSNNEYPMLNVEVKCRKIKIMN
jgi:hypothetical protein